MMTALYVFIGILAATLVLYILDRFLYFIRKIKKKLEEKDEYESRFERAPESRYDCHYSSGEARLLYELRDALDRIESSIDDLDLQLTNMNTKLDLIDSKVEDTAALMSAKEHPKE